MSVILSFDTICHLHCHLRVASPSHLLFYLLFYLRRSLAMFPLSLSQLPIACQLAMNHPGLLWPFIIEILWSSNLARHLYYF